MMRVLGCLRTHPSDTMIVDPSLPDHDKCKSPEGINWEEFCLDAKPEKWPGIPEELGKAVRITCHVDADHAHDHLTHRSVTSIILFINNTPIRWLSKHQKTVETSTCGSELVAARIAIDLIIEMCHNLRSSGVPVDGPALLLGDNQSVVLNTTVPSLVFKKKHNAVAFHWICEAITARICHFVHTPSHGNHADVTTKTLCKADFQCLSHKVLFRQPAATCPSNRVDPIIWEQEHNKI